MFRRLGILVSFALALSACNRIQATAEAKPARPKSAAKAKKEVEAKPKVVEAEEHEGPKKFVVPFAWEASRDEPLSQARAYLDHASSSPLRPAALEAMLPYLREHPADPGRVHSEGKVTRVAIETAGRVPSTTSASLNVGGSRRVTETGIPSATVTGTASDAAAATASR